MTNETANEPLIDNDLRNLRVEAGFDTPEQLAAAVDIDPEWYGHMEAGHVVPTHAQLDRLTAALGVARTRVYSIGSLNLISGQRNNEANYSVAKNFRDQAETAHLLLTPDEITWFERQPGPDHRVEVFMNLSCGTQLVPHLLQDTVAVLDRLNVSYLAAAGSAACCGKPFTNADQPETAERVNTRRIDRSLGWGATTHVNWCVACQMTSTVAASRRYYADGVEHPVREVQVLTFLEERIRDMGDRVPWRTRPNRRVLVSGHSALFGPAHREAHRAAVQLLELIPGVEVVERYEAHSDESPCTPEGRYPDWTPPAWLAEQDTAAGIRAHRARLAAMARSKGADTVACTHQTCHGRWSRYASDQLAVRHPVSILAEALDCAHPDRRQAAVRVGDPDVVVEQTRSIWQSWGMTEARARELAAAICDPKFADEDTQCSCSSAGNGGACRENLISIDVVTGQSRFTRAVGA